jgi:trimeric autotransporter adhesin
MKILPSFALAAGLGMLLAAGPSSTTSASPRRITAMPASDAGRALGRERTPQSRGRATASGCSGNYGTKGEFFVGVTGGANVAHGQFGAVLGGDSNQACDLESAIGAGYGNFVGNGNGDAGASFVGGGDDNTISAGGAFVGAGVSNGASGAGSSVGAGYHNTASGIDSIVGNGASNTASGLDSAVAGGYFNVAAGSQSFAGAGSLSSVTGNGSFVGAGDYTYQKACGCTAAGNQMSGTDSFVGAGDQNAVSADESFVGSGQSNSITPAAAYSAIVGGGRNSAGGEYAAVLGGYGNSATGSYGVVAGGDGNIASGVLSFAGGYHADAVHNGSFVWSDYSSGSALLKDAAANQFVVRASGGADVYSNEAATAGVKLGPGSGTWASLSDRTAKADIEPLDGASILAKVAALPISTWRYKTESGVRHVGPMAQDFYAAFGVGEDDRHLTSIDEDGVALAAIKGLHRENARLQSRLAALEAKVQAMERERAAPPSRTTARRGFRGSRRP